MLRFRSQVLLWSCSGLLLGWIALGGDSGAVALTGSMIVGADAECTADSNDPDKCHWKCIRNNCDFQAYPCADPATLNCGNVGDEFIPKVSPASCETDTGEKKPCDLKCSNIPRWICKIAAGTNTATCDPNSKEKLTTRCNLAVKTRADDPAAPKIKVLVEKGTSMACPNGPMSDPEYKCPLL